MWKREVTIEVSIGMLTSILKILLNYQVLVKIKFWLAIAWVKVMTSLMMTSITEIFLNFMALKTTSKFRLSAWLRQNFLQIEHYFSSDGVFPIVTSLNDDITLKISITLYHP